MEALQWLGDNWFELFQSLGIVASLLVAAYTMWQDTRSRKIANFSDAKQQHREIWSQASENPALLRVRKRDVDLGLHPVTEEELLFVKALVFHLDWVYRAVKSGLFVKLEALQKDVREFFALPIPNAVWARLKEFQDAEFVRFVEDCLRH
jgi:hypothetical protein